MATEHNNWQRIQPDTPLSELTAGDLMDVIGWAMTTGRPVMETESEKGMVPGWKEVGVWGDWRSNWWGLSGK